MSQGEDSLASKLAASPVWLSLTVDADTFPATGQQVMPTTHSELNMPQLVIVVHVPVVQKISMGIKKGVKKKKMYCV